VSWFANLFSVLTEYLGIPVYQRTTHNHYGPGAPTITDNPGQNRTDFYYSGAPATGAFGSQNITVGTGTPPELQIGFVAHATTTDASPATLLTYALPAASTSDVELRVVANMGGSGTVNQNDWPTIFRFEAEGVRVGTGGVAATIDDDRSTISTPFIAAVAGAPTTGTVNVTSSGNNLLVQVQGFAPPSAWQPTTGYTHGNGSSTVSDFVTNGGNVYVCKTTGTSAGSGGPTGTGANITDGTAHWTFVAVGSQFPIAWTLVVTGLVTGQGA
jgi:hypothetical protein